MIKKESELNNNYLICLNPNCSLPQQRIFETKSNHCEMIDCKKWILKKAEMNTQSTELPPQAINISFENHSIQQYFSALNRLEGIDWPAYFQQQKKRIIQSLQHQISQQFSIIQKQITQLSSSLHSYRSIMAKQNFVEASQEINQFIDTHINPLINKTISINLDKNPFLTFPDIVLNSMREKYFNSQNFHYPSLVQSTKKIEQKIQNFLFSDNAFNKLQLICSLSEIPQIKYESHKENIKLSCPFCRQKIFNEVIGKKKTSFECKVIKKHLANKMIHHIWDSHNEIVKKVYRLKYMPDKAQNFNEISYQDLIYQIKNYKYLLIIDRESGIKESDIKGFNRSEKMKQKLVIEILSKGNKKMAKQKYILTDDRASTQFLMNYAILDICFFKKLIEPENYCIISNSRKQEKIESLFKLFQAKNDKYSNIVISEIVKNENNHRIPAENRINIIKSEARAKHQFLQVKLQAQIQDHQENK